VNGNHATLLIGWFAMKVGVYARSMAEMANARAAPTWAILAKQFAQRLAILDSQTLAGMSSVPGRGRNRLMNRRIGANRLLDQQHATSFFREVFGPRRWLALRM
jgi:hypothetical protein